MGRGDTAEALVMEVNRRPEHYPHTTLIEWDEDRVTGALIAAKRVTDSNICRQRSLVVDMDDTLICNQIYFEKSKQKVITLAQSIRPELSEQQIRQALADGDARHMPQYGYTPARWRAVVPEAVQILKGAPLTDRELDAANEAAEQAFELGEILPGVEPVLEHLKRQRVNMLLKTKGEADIQAAKLDKHRFDRFFDDNIWVVDRKDDKTFAEARHKYQLGERVLSIGDSEHSDILPAINNGFEGVLIEVGSFAWSYEQSGLQIKRVPSFSQAIEQTVVLD